MLKLHADLIGEALVLSTHLSRFFVEVLCQCVEILHVPDFLLFLLNLKGSNILFDFTFSNSVIIFSIFECYFSFFLKLS